MISTDKEIMGTCTYVPSSLDFYLKQSNRQCTYNQISAERLKKIQYANIR